MTALPGEHSTSPGWGGLGAFYHRMTGTSGRLTKGSEEPPSSTEVKVPSF